MNDNEKYTAVRTALVGIIGADDPAELQSMRKLLIATMPPGHDLNCIIAGIDALLETAK